MEIQITKRPCILLTTWPNRKEALIFSQQLVEMRLAACVNLLPKAYSIFAWEGTLEQVQEHQMIIKTCHHLVPKIVQLLKSMHPYSMPETLSLNIDDGGQDYLDWIKNHCQ
jgi:periplasmic divalent cation tolerance protein